MRALTGAILVLAAASLTAVSLAGCGTVRVPSASTPSARPGAATSARGLPTRLAHSTLTTPAPGLAAPPAGSRAEATALAGRLLSLLELPAGARRLPATSLPPSLREPATEVAGASASLDLYRLFAVPQPLDALAGALAARVPAGLSLGSTGQSSGPGEVTTREVGYAPRSVPAGIYSAQLVVTMAPAASGGSLLRADAEVIWYPPRTAAEYIDPARYHVLTVTVTLSGRSEHTITRVVTSRAVIRALAVALNRSQAEPPLILECPLIFATYRLAFAESRHSRPAVVVTATRWPCGGSGITVGGRAQPALADNGAVVAIADRVLGINPRGPPADPGPMLEMTRGG